MREPRGRQSAQAERGLDRPLGMAWGDSPGRSPSRFSGSRTAQTIRCGVRVQAAEDNPARGHTGDFDARPGTPTTQARGVPAPVAVRVARSLRNAQAGRRNLLFDYSTHSTQAPRSDGLQPRPRGPRARSPSRAELLLRVILIRIMISETWDAEVHGHANHHPPISAANLLFPRRVRGRRCRYNVRDALLVSVRLATGAHHLVSRQET